MIYLGLNKGFVQASACLIDPRRATTEIFLKERLTRKKYDGRSLVPVLQALSPRLDPARTRVAESSYNLRPIDEEKRLDREAPYFESLRRLGLAAFTSRYNRALPFLPHHYCHAVAAASVSPFERSVIVVLDGGGSLRAAFPDGHPELRLGADDPGIAESCTVYLQDGPKLRAVRKEWQKPIRIATSRGELCLSEGLGSFYEAAALFVFNSLMDAGKLMGLAPFGKAVPLGPERERGRSYLASLDWNRAFAGTTKREWERSPHLELYREVAATTQSHFEDRLFRLLESVRSAYPDRANLVLTGGCALNCVANMKVFDSGLFDSVYVPPFPGDECIALGAAEHLRLKAVRKAAWRPLEWDAQTSFFGPASSAPDAARIRRAFAGFRITAPADLCAHAALELARGRIIGWFQGRSESGPRALGHRSILADPRIPGLKRRLNDRVKGRESFRPYGASCLWEKSHEYFEVPRGFESPFMSFAPSVRATYSSALRSVTHVDGTSRIQTVRRSQNRLFHALLRRFGEETGLYCLLNTSMNVMGEPIVETVEDARRFFDNTPVDAIVVQDLCIQRT